MPGEQVTSTHKLKEAQEELAHYVKEAKRDDLSIEQTLDIFDEALKVGSAAIDELNVDALLAEITSDEEDSSSTDAREVTEGEREDESLS